MTQYLAAFERSLQHLGCLGPPASRHQLRVLTLANRQPDRAGPPARVHGINVHSRDLHLLREPLRHLSLRILIAKLAYQSTHRHARL